jgi:hypothetical protein
VLCVLPSVERGDLLESVARIETARLQQIVPRIELKSGDPPVLSDEFVDHLSTSRRH